VKALRNLYYNHSSAALSRYDVFQKNMMKPMNRERMHFAVRIPKLPDAFGVVQVCPSLYTATTYILAQRHGRNPRSDSALEGKSPGAGHGDTRVDAAR
jgi:hypothetical protein